MDKTKKNIEQSRVCEGSPTDGIGIYGGISVLENHEKVIWMKSFKSISLLKKWFKSNQKLFPKIWRKSKSNHRLNYLLKYPFHQVHWIYLIQC